jgi:HEAT repeat protein
MRVNPAFALIGVTTLLSLTAAVAGPAIQQWIGLGLQLGGDPVAASHAVLGEHEMEEIEGLPPQKQAVRLLQRAVNGYRGALEQIESRADGWRGQIELDEELNKLTYVAYCSSNIRVRAAAVEISLAGYGLEKSTRALDEQIMLLRTNAPKKFYPLWKLGLLGNRGVAPDTARRALLDYVNDPDEVTRRWAVEGLGMLGASEAIEPLIEVFRRDPSPEIRERAACNLVDSGMMTKEQRMKAIPYLLEMSDDPSLDAQTRGWVYQALREISGESLATDPTTWRNWWAKHNQ